MYLRQFGVSRDAVEVLCDVVLHKPCSPDDNWDDLNLVQISGVSEIMFQVLVLVDLFSLHSVQAKVIRY